MKTYTVIWRDGGDDYAFTEVTTDVDPNLMTNGDWVFLAGEVEYAGWDDADRVTAMAELLDDYELLEVVVGSLVSVL
jgi:hypothetical protein